MATTVEPRIDADIDISRFFFKGVSWEDYEAMLRIIGDRPIRATYDQGSLELMSPLWGHGSRSYLLARLVDHLCLELDIRITGGDPVTFKRKDLGKGIEPDRCYYLRENAAKVRGRERLDLTVDPPPDLAIEMEVTSSMLSRIGIFAALGIPEVWRYDGDELQFLHLEGDGAYQAREQSRNFPYLSVTETKQFLDEAKTLETNDWIRAFLDFVRETIAPRAAGGAP